jgi:hypothetical protein
MSKVKMASSEGGHKEFKRRSKLTLQQLSRARIDGRINRDNLKIRSKLDQVPTSLKQSNITHPL